MVTHNYLRSTLNVYMKRNRNFSAIFGSKGFPRNLIWKLILRLYMRRLVTLWLKSFWSFYGAMKEFKMVGNHTSAWSVVKAWNISYSWMVTRKNHLGITELYVCMWQAVWFVWESSAYLWSKSQKKTNPQNHVKCHLGIKVWRLWQAVYLH